MRKTYLILGVVLLLAIAGLLAFFYFLKPTTKIVQPGFCKILEEKYCSQGELVYYELNGKKYPYIGINLPPGVRVPVPVYAATNGHFFISKESGSFYGRGIRIQTAAGELFSLKGNIDTSQWGNLTDIGDVSAGTILGYAQTSPNKSLGKYDLVFTITHKGLAGPETMNEELKKIFKF